jgi:2-haloacid dehalogenase
MTQSFPSIIVFDIGGVLLDWDPRYLYRKLFDDEAAMEAFLAEICTPEWNERMDAGMSFDDGVAELTNRHPHHAEMISAYHYRWIEMIPSAIEGTVDILKEARDRDHPVYAITNFNAEKLAIASELYPFLKDFDGVIVSSEVRLIKPDPAIFQAFFQTYDKQPSDCVFIDDREANVEAANTIGMRGIHFSGPSQLRSDLTALNFL